MQGEGHLYKTSSTVDNITGAVHSQTNLLYLISSPLVYKLDLLWTGIGRSLRPSTEGGALRPSGVGRSQS